MIRSFKLPYTTKLMQVLNWSAQSFPNHKLFFSLFALSQSYKHTRLGFQYPSPTRLLLPMYLVSSHKPAISSLPTAAVNFSPLELVSAGAQYQQLRPQHNQTHLPSYFPFKIYWMLLLGSQLKSSKERSKLSFSLHIFNMGKYIWFVKINSNLTRKLD